MAVLYITEYSAISIPDAPIAPGEAIASQTVAIGGSSTQSSAFNAQTRYVRLHTDAICSILFGSNPTATATTARMAADATEYFSVNPSTKVAVITNT